MLYINSESTKKDIKEVNSFAITAQETKYMGINLT